ncbi:hypothetical protein E3T28_16120 [Cryobacterium sinapicolor]|uniref:Uncharacterized protein n=1 Tax=Cryobacterium sinapicolor TaxID=1259236 RepID=A0ABY2ISY9_9MICO|nr:MULTISPECIES: hypothetical protein [Cryobacterium]TFC93257.1 hypothetical protein E3O67_02355 [Cryobacterium sp. TMT3-29-2]TFC93924.1 hypothetical protein E3T28_16120 [Cryobacterium sinapicolor]
MSAIIFCVLMWALVVFQAALIAGAPIGQFAWGGQDRILPIGKRIGSATSIALYVVFALVVLQDGQLIAIIPWPEFTDIAIWVLAAYFIIGIIMNGISRSLPERWTMAPLCTVLAALTVLLALD